MGRTDSFATREQYFAATSTPLVYSDKLQMYFLMASASIVFPVHS
jgi:hypothetical protein